MGRQTGIEWAHTTWNPWMGCTKVSAGCKNCYMFREQSRFGHDPTKLRRSKTTFEEPLKWKEPKRIFVCSWSDFFLETVPIEVIVGGESGPNARPMKPEWVRAIRDQCVKYGVPFWFKQWGGTNRVDGTWGGNMLDGKKYEELPNCGE